MTKAKFINAFSNTFSSSNIVNLSIFVLFIIFFTVLLSSKYFLFQNIISPDGISKKDVIAKRNIVVVDVFKTEQQRKEVSQRIEPILTPAEDTYIQNNLSALEKAVDEIREKDTNYEQKRIELSTLFDIKDTSRKQLIINYLITSSNNDVKITFKKSAQILDNILKSGISENDYSNIDIIIFKKMSHDLSKTKISIIGGILEQVIVPNLIVDEKATAIARQNAINSLKPITVTFEKGDKIVFQGEPITKLKRDALNQAGYNVLEFNYKGFLSLLFLSLVSIVSLIYYLYFFDKTYLSKGYLTILGALATLMAIFAIIRPDNISIYVLPFPAFAMLCTVFINSRVSIVASAVSLALIGASMQFSMPAIVIFLITIILSSIATSRIKYARRVDLIKTGVEISIATTLLIASSYLLASCINTIDLMSFKNDMLAGFINGIISGMIVLGIIPVLESLFKIITPYGLAEFCDHNHPLLKRLQESAPGTFSHSLMVSNLCETVAEAIGADPVLARVGALYHDVGKLKRPLFFVENQTYFGIANQHDTLNPRLSKMIITSHTRDGMELAKDYGIPPIIQNFIIQHHGECLAGHFYTQALEKEGQENVTKEQFRYSGPKPNMKETAILMIADAVESASRSLKEYTEEELDNVINKIITDRLNDGQLSDSPMTLRDLKITAQTLKKSIKAAHHQRVQYHENIIEELENKFSKIKVAEPSKLTDTELEDKIEKKIEKRRQETEYEKNTES